MFKTIANIIRWFFPAGRPKNYVQDYTGGSWETANKEKNAQEWAKAGHRIHWIEWPNGEWVEYDGMEFIRIKHGGQSIIAPYVPSDAERIGCGWSVVLEE